MAAIAFWLSIYLLCIQSLKSPLVYLDISTLIPLEQEQRLK